MIYDIPKPEISPKAEVQAESTAKRFSHAEVMNRLHSIIEGTSTNGN
jgi:hypothetical protein